MRRLKITRCPSVRAAVLLSLTTLLLPAFAQDQTPLASPTEHIQEIERRMQQRAATLPPNERQAWQMLQRMIHADLTQVYLAREIRQVAQGKETEQWIRCDPERGVRIESIRPDNRIIIDTKQQAFIYEPREKQWFSKSSAMPVLRRIFREVLNRLDKGELKATLDGQDTIAGRSCVIVRVAPAENGPGPSHRFWIDKVSGLRLKMEVVGQDGHIFSASYFLSVDLTPRFRPDDFTPPANATPRNDHQPPGQTFKSIAEAQQAHVDVPDPRYIPTGYTLKKVEVYGPESHKPRITIRYSNGLSAISLTTFKSENVPPRLRERFMSSAPGFLPNPQGNGERAYLWQNGSHVYILFSALPDDEVKRIAEQAKQ